MDHAAASREFDEALTRAIASLRVETAPWVARKRESLEVIALRPVAAERIVRATALRVSYPMGRASDDVTDERLAELGRVSAALEPVRELACARLADDAVAQWLRAHVGDAAVDALLMSGDRGRIDRDVVRTCVLAHPRNVATKFGVHSLVFLALDGGAALDDGRAFVARVAPCVLACAGPDRYAWLASTAPTLRPCIVDLERAKATYPASATQHHWTRDLRVERIEDGGVVCNGALVAWAALEWQALSSRWPAPAD